MSPSLMHPAIQVEAKPPLAPVARPPVVGVPPLWTWLVVAVPVLIVGVGAWFHRWAAAGAYVDFRVIHNIWAGFGPVFNPGERVEVYTDPLWVFVLTVVGGVFRFVPIAWLAVVLGILATAGGFCLGGRAAQRLAGREGLWLVIPLGLLTASALDAVWDFASSGLATGFIFGWEGLSWWLLVRVATTRRGVLVTAFVIGLGPLIRPDLGLFSLAFLAALAVPISWDQSQPVRRWLCRWGAPGLAALLLPGAYQLWRMAYFAMVVPNTALATSSGRTGWSQGFSYLRDFATSGLLFIPAMVLVATVAVRLVGAVRSRDRVLGLIIMTPLIGGLLDGIYVIGSGGDVMHARTLLPSFFALCLVAGVALPGVTSLKALHHALPVALILLFTLASGFFLRDDNNGKAMANGIANERAFWVANSGDKHPITTGAYRRLAQIRQGQGLERLARDVPPGSYDLVTDVPGPQVQVIVPAPSPGLPERVIATVEDIDLTGAAAGPSVYAVDPLALSDPLVSHTVGTDRVRPAHPEIDGVVWTIARFAPPGSSIPSLAGSSEQLDAARQALACPSLKRYLYGITAPFGLSLGLSNLAHALADTTLTFSATPTVAIKQLCRPPS